MFFFFMQKTSYEMRISDCSSDLCSSDLHGAGVEVLAAERVAGFGVARTDAAVLEAARLAAALEEAVGDQRILANARHGAAGAAHADRPILEDRMIRSEEHTSELQSLMRTSYAVFCFKKQKHCEDTGKTHSP